MKWYFYYALKQLFPSGKKISFFSAMSIFGVAIGVMVLFVVQSVMDGFQEKIKKTIVQSQGDIRIDSPYIIYDIHQLENCLKNFPEIEASAQYVYGTVMLKHENRPVFPIIKGIDLANETKVIDLKNFIKFGNLDDLASNTIILSSELSKRIAANIGSSIEIYSPTMLENSDAEEIILPKIFEVCGIYETGNHNLDNNVAIISISNMQDLYGLGNGIHGLSIKVRKNTEPAKVAADLNNLLPSPLQATSWQEMNKDFLFALRTEKTMMGFVLIFILLVSAFSITSSLTISVIRKTREIGLLMALGGTIKQCASCFILQSFIIGTIGSFLGISLGSLVLKFRNEIVSMFIKICGVDDFMLKFYSFSEMPSSYGFVDISKIILFAVLICCCAGLLPAVRAAKIKPAEALRNE